MVGIIEGAMIRVFIALVIAVIIKKEKFLTGPWWFGVLALTQYSFYTDGETIDFAFTVGFFIPEHWKLVVLLNKLLAKEEKEKPKKKTKIKT